MTTQKPNISIAFIYLSYFLMIAALFFPSGKANAQISPSRLDSKIGLLDAPKTWAHELKVGYGLGSNINLTNSFSNALMYTLSDNVISEKNQSTTEIGFVSYKYTFKNHFTIGGSIVCEQLRSTPYSYNQAIGKITRTYTTFAVEIDYRYIHKRFFSMYSGLGIGTTYERRRYKPSGEKAEIKNSEVWNFQLTALGFRGGNRLGAFAELGFGYRGIVNAGLFVRF